MDTQSENEKSSTWKALMLAWQLGYSIALPIVAFALLGRTLDRWLGASPLFLAIGVILAIVTTAVWLTHKAKRMLEDIEQGERQKQIKPPQQ